MAGRQAGGDGGGGARGSREMSGGVFMITG